MTWFAQLFCRVSALMLMWCLPSLALEGYRAELNIPFSTVDGKTLTMNAFLPEQAERPAPAMVYFYGGWWFGGGAAGKIEDVPGWDNFTKRGAAVFSNQYRLGREGGFPQNIRDCRNAIRYIRQHAKEFNIDPERIACTGISAGGYLTYMVTLAPEDFDDGGATKGLEGVSARVCGGFGYVGPTDFVDAWERSPDDTVSADGEKKHRPPDNNIYNDYRPRLRILFHGMTPETEAGRMLYARMSPVNLARKGTPPLLIGDGEKDLIVPFQPGRVLHEKLRAADADAVYWMTPGGGHGYPGGRGFQEVLNDFLNRIWQPAQSK
ncbi:MAG: alpha/beta hydrolase [Verrucomicrobiales bacterium]|jgi:acetyl esterase/lipase|nr:alpha/beta hydrolase [Verrucomicrobiales bacterium]